MRMKAIKGVYSSLHEDLLIEILLRLPVKSLLRFKTVCQRWHSIVKTPGFIRNYNRRETTPGLLVYWDGEVSIPRENEEDEIQYVNAISVFPDNTLERRWNIDQRELLKLFCRMHGPCNGVFCILLRENILYLWNPATRMLRAVPCCPFGPICTYEFGFGIDTITDDIKIVLFGLNSCIRSERPGFAVYNVTDGSWKWFVDEALSDPDASLLRNDYNSGFPNGFFYWIKCKSWASFHFVILAFDMHNEVFQEIEMPKITLKSSLEQEQPYKRRLKLKLRLQWYGDSLALLTYHRVAGERCFDMWLMKEEGCWTKMSTVSLPLEPFGALGVWKRNSVFAVTSDGKLMIHDLDSHNTINIGFWRKKYASSDRAIYAFPYKESLVSL